MRQTAPKKILQLCGQTQILKLRQMKEFFNRHTDKSECFVHRAQNGNQCSSAQRTLCSSVSSLRGRLNPATSSKLHIRPERERGETFVTRKQRNRRFATRGPQRDHRYLACDCIVSLQSVEGPFDVLTAEHPEICHEQVGGLHHSCRSHRAQFGVVKKVLRHLKRPKTNS